MKAKKFKFLAWKIDLKIRHMSADDRIVFLTNRLLDEIENAGYDTEGVAGKLKCVDISNFKSSERLTIGMSVSKTPWCITSKRKYSKEASNAEV